MSNLSLIPTTVGKKVYSTDGTFLGEVVRVYMSEFGVHMAEIKTTFEEFPKFEVVVTQLRPAKIRTGGTEEDAFILREIPIKLQMLLIERLGLEKAKIPTIPKPIGPYSPYVRAGNFLFVSGQLPIDPSSGTIVGGGIREQTIRCLENIKAILETAGYALNNVVMVFVYLTDLSKISEFNEVYASYFPLTKPARVTVGVSQLPQNALVEISVVAYKD